MLNLVLLSLAAFSLVDAGDVLTLTDADFDSRLSDLDLVLVKFYAPWYVFFVFQTTRYSGTYSLALGDCNTTADCIMVQESARLPYVSLKNLPTTST